jgi:hypothetical protein
MLLINQYLEISINKHDYTAIIAAVKKNNQIKKGWLIIGNPMIPTLCSPDRNLTCIKCLGNIYYILNINNNV